jgi:hypothetical protein
LISSDSENRQLFPTRQPRISPRWASLRTVARWILSNLATCPVVRNLIIVRSLFRGHDSAYGKAFGPICGRGVLKRKKRARVRVAGASATLTYNCVPVGVKQKSDNSIFGLSRVDERGIFYESDEAVLRLRCAGVAFRSGFAFSMLCLSACIRSIICPCHGASGGATVIS